VLALVAMTSACRSSADWSRGEKELSLDDAVRQVRELSALSPVFIVDGRVVERAEDLPRERVLRAVVPTTTPGHCEERFRVRGECRPIILVYMRRQ
jgi:hypothetical protein